MIDKLTENREYNCQRIEEAIANFRSASQQLLSRNVESVNLCLRYSGKTSTKLREPKVTVELNF